jgi:peptide/nickel transport system substrate-binding protein
VQNVHEAVLVNIDVKDVSGQTVFFTTVETDGSGNFAIQFEVPESAPEGSFVILATTVVGGETVGSTRTVSVSASQAPPTSQCIIATAAFGSELAPQVQFLRNFRDQHILATASGSSFMAAFNAWYYSFSPYVADYERGQPWLQQVVRTSIYPLLGILTVSEKAYSALPGEYGSVAAGLVASSLIGAVYLSPAALAVKRARNVKLGYLLIAVLACVAAVAGSLVVVNSLALMVAGSLLVLSTIAASAIASARYLSKMRDTVRRARLR